MTNEITILVGTAASLGFIHTLIGPDHYIPFVVIGKAKKWPMHKTIFLTIVSGIGHVGSSIILGLLGVLFGIGLSKLVHIESQRGDIVAWLLILFGFIYFCWGIYKARQNHTHKHIHFHKDGSTHEHEHTHLSEHSHIHTNDKAVNLTPWIIFTIFVFGPCEPLIPLLMYPAAELSMGGVALVAGVFGFITISTMTLLVFLITKGVNFLPLQTLEKYMHAIAGATILLCGLAIKLGL